MAGEDSDSSSRLELETTFGSEQCKDVDSSKLSYLPDVLAPDQCHLLLEGCKPLITLKSCVFKYVLMELLQVGEVSWQGSVSNNLDFDLDLLIKILKKIQKSKQLMHPLLGIPIITYSVSPRVQHCVGQNRRLTRDTENRLSEILYGFLGLLIETLDRKCRSLDTVVQMTTHL